MMTHLPREFLFPDFPSRLGGEKLESEDWRQFKSKNREERFAACLSSVGGFHDDIMERAVIIFNILARLSRSQCPQARCLLHCTTPHVRQVLRYSTLIYL
jgi:hypothetical protein